MIMTNVQIKVPNWLDRFLVWPLLIYRKRKYGYTFRRIDLGQGDWTIVDQQDYYRYGNLNWSVMASNGKLYAACILKTGPMKTNLVRLHRLILSPPPGLLVDHKNSNSLDNRRENLRPATRSQNACNRRSSKSKKSSRFIGPSLDKRRGKWAVKLINNGNRIWIGYFEDEIEAAHTYDAAAKKYHGEFARLNFPEESQGRL